MDFFAEVRRVLDEREISDAVVNESDKQRKDSDHENAAHE